MANINNNIVRTKMDIRHLNVISGEFFTMIYSVRNNYDGYTVNYSVSPTININGTTFALKTNYVNDEFIVFTEKEAHEKMYNLFWMNEQNATYETRIWDGDPTNMSDFKYSVYGEFDFFTEKDIMFFNRDRSLMWSFKIGNPTQFSRDYCEVDCEETVWRTDDGHGTATNSKIYGIIIDDSFVDVDLSASA